MNSCTFMLFFSLIALTLEVIFFIYFWFAFIQNVCGTEWPFMFWCAVKRLTHWLTQTVFVSV